jgi:Leucine-rich repeat (LRR) protein
MFTSLKELHLAANNICFLPPEIGLLASLKKLDLSSNQLNNLPPGHEQNLSHMRRQPPADLPQRSVP